MFANPTITLKYLIAEFRHLSKDPLGRTSLISHDIDVNESMFIKHHPYHFNPHKSAIVKEEKKYIHKNDLMSPVSAPGVHL